LSVEKKQGRGGAGQGEGLKGGFSELSFEEGEKTTHVKPEKKKIKDLSWGKRRKSGKKVSIRRR